MSFRQKVRDERFFFLQLIFRRGDFRPAEVVERHALDDFEVLAVTPDRIAEDQSLLDAVTAVGMHGHAEPIAGGRRVREFEDRVDGGVGGTGGAAQSARLDDGRATLLNRRDEFALQPDFVLDDGRNRLAGNPGVEEIREHRGAVIAPDGKVGDGGDVHAGLFRKLRLRAVFVERGHGEKPFLRHAGRVVGGDERIGVARIADDEHAHVGGGVFGDGIALAGEYFPVDAEQILAFHAGLARHRADKQRPVHAAKAFVEIRGRHNAFKQRKGTVVEFHADAVQRGHRLFIGNFYQVEDDRLFWSERRAGRDAEQE